MSDKDSKKADDYDKVQDSTELKPKKQKSKKNIAIVVLSIAVFLIIAIFATATAVFYHYYSLMEITDDTTSDSNYISYSDDMQYSDEDSDVDLPKENIYSEEGVVNILLIGTDERSEKFSQNSRADSVMILSLNQNTNKVKLVSLERGMTVKIPGRSDDLLTHTFHWGGTSLLLRTVRTHFNVDVDKYVRINLKMFEKMIDEVGGVDIMLTEKDVRGLNTFPNGNTLKLDRVLSAGQNHLNGFEALQYSRLRWIDSDWCRVERQRKVLASLKNKMKDMSLIELSSMAETCLPLVRTNITSGEFAGLLISLPSLLNGELEQMTLPKSGTYSTLGNVDFKANSKILREFLYKK